MKPTTFLPALLGLALVSASAPAAADIVACGQNVATGTICLTGDIEDGDEGPLASGQVYVVVGDITVPPGATLTADGAILKFDTNTSLGVQGTLSASGTTFTSLHDDTAGGDTNKNGSNTTPSAGDWTSIVFSGAADASDLVSSEIRYAFRGVELFDADIKISATNFRDCEAEGLTLRDTSLPTVTGCSFTNTGSYAIDDASFDALPNFLGNTATGNTKSRAIRVTEGTLQTSVSLIPALALNGDGVFHVREAPIVPVGEILMIHPGVILKFTGDAGSVDVRGTLIAEGVVFTSIEDDANGGDTNANGGATTPAPGDWWGLIFQSGADASELENSQVLFGGRNVSVSGGPVVTLLQADIQIESLLVKDCKSHGLDLNRTSFPTVFNSAFRDGGGHPVVGVKLKALPGFTLNVATGNAAGNTTRLDDPTDTLSANISIDPGHTLNGDGRIVVAADPTIAQGASLTVAEGMTFLMGANRIWNVRGTLDCNGSEGSAIVFTTEGTQVPGAWDGLVFFAGSDASDLTDVQVLYAGKGGAGAEVSAAIELREGASPSLLSVKVQHSEQAGLDLNSSAKPSVIGCAFDDNLLAVKGVSIGAVAGFVQNTAANNVGGDYLEISDGDVASGTSVTLSPSASLNQTAVFVVSASIVVDTGATLTVKERCILKMDHSGNVLVKGRLLTGGGSFISYFTVFEDDSIGGDTNNDGSATSPSPGDWIGIELTGSPAGSALDLVEVRYAGRLGASVQLTGAIAPILNILEVRFGKGTALLCNPTARPSVRSCTFEQCDLAVDGVSINALPNFSDVTASGNTNGDYIRVVHGAVEQDLDIRPKNSIDGILVLATSLHVPAGKTLALSSGFGFVLKWEGAFGATIDGTLEVNKSRGPGSVVGIVAFTSIHDDAIHGDTNKNGSATTPGPGDWGAFVFNPSSDESVLLYADFRYGGAVWLATLYLIGADIELEQCCIEFSKGDGLNLANGSQPTVRNCKFRNCGDVAVDNVPVAAIDGFSDNTASGNAVLDSLRVRSAILNNVDVVLEKHNALNGDGVVVIDADVSVNASSRVVLGPGLVLKFTPGKRLTANGVLEIDGTGYEPVMLTSVLDDFAGEAAGGAAPGDWGGVVYQSGNLAVRAAHATIRYAGSGGLAGLQAFLAPGLELFAVRTEHCLNDGFLLGGLAADPANLVAYQCGGNGIQLIGGTHDLLFATVYGSGSVGITATAGHLGGVSSSIAYGNAGGPIAGFVAGEVYFSNVGPAFAGANGNVDADPQFVNPANGDLRLGPSSPGLNAGESAQAVLVQKDFDERSRALDHDLSGAMVPDMGAHERAAYELVVNGEPAPGATLDFQVQGPPGAATFEVAFAPGFAVVDPLGHRLIAPQARTLKTAPVGATASLVMPETTQFVKGTFPGGEFFVQATAHPNAAPSRGNLTQVYRARLQDTAAPGNPILQPPGQFP